MSEFSFFKWAKDKKAAAGIYANWFRLRTRRSWRRRSNQRILRHAQETLRVRIDSPVGFFAHLSWCTEVVAYCEKRKLRPYLTCTSKQYGDQGRDWFNVFFRQPPLAQAADAKAKGATLQVHEFEEMPFYMAYNPAFTIEEMSRLQRAYFPLAKHIETKVEAFTGQYFQSRKIVGCHYRGTDKGVEATRIAYDEMTVALRNALSEFPAGAALFIATDEAAFLEHARKMFPATTIISADHKRSTDGRALHFASESQGLAHGEQALVDCLLLSRCDHLVKSPSALSAWAKVFNPALPVTLIGRPFAQAMFFPESILVRQQDEMLAGKL